MRRRLSLVVRLMVGWVSVGGLATDDDFRSLRSGFRADAPAFGQGNVTLKGDLKGKKILTSKGILVLFVATLVAALPLAAEKHKDAAKHWGALDCQKLLSLQTIYVEGNNRAVSNRIYGGELPGVHLARADASQGVAPALTGSRMAVTGGPADGTLAKVGGADRFVHWAQNADPRIARPTGQSSTKRKALNPRTNVPPVRPIHG